MSKIHDRMRKLLALAERGVGGERDTAQKMLEKMMQKYGVTLDDLGVDTKERHYWNYDNKFERCILAQVASKVLDSTEFSYWKGDRKLGFELTKAEYIEFDLNYTILRRDLKKHIERAVDAFIQANNIFAQSAGSEDTKEYTAEEMQEIEEMLRMAGSIRPSQVNRQLEKL